MKSNFELKKEEKKLRNVVTKFPTLPISLPILLLILFISFLYFVYACNLFYFPIKRTIVHNDSKNPSNHKYLKLVSYCIERMYECMYTLYVRVHHAYMMKLNFSHTNRI